MAGTATMDVRIRICVLIDTRLNEDIRFFIGRDSAQNTAFLHRFRNLIDSRHGRTTLLRMSNCRPCRKQERHRHRQTSRAFLILPTNKLIGISPDYFEFLFRRQYQYKKRPFASQGDFGRKILFMFGKTSKEITAPLFCFFESPAIAADENRARRKELKTATNPI
jgi:hypothetical protein